MLIFTHVSDFQEKKKMASDDYKLDPENYFYLRCIGEGDFGEVWKCLNFPTQRCVAVKIPTYISEREDEVRLFVHCLLERLYGQK